MKYSATSLEYDLLSLVIRVNKTREQLLVLDITQLTPEGTHNRCAVAHWGSVTCIASFNVWVRYFECNFKVIL